MDEVIVEWEVTMKCNYNCAYCTTLDKTIKNAPKEKLLDFQKSLNVLYPDIEIFVFGGEPFLHPDIKEIIKNFKNLNQQFVIQTNASTQSVNIMKDINTDININISIHPEDTSIDQVLEALFIISNNKFINIKNIDIMYVGKLSLKYYTEIKKLNIKTSLNVLPVSDFTEGKYKEHLIEFNKLKQSSISKFISFEKLKKLDPFTNILKDRSFIWEDMHVNGKITTGRPCMYKNKYFLYSADLKLHNCCFRTTNNGICEQSSCFMM